MQKKNLIKSVLKPVLFLVILVLIANILMGILKKPITGRWESGGMNRVYSNRDYYDVILCGTSMTLTNVSVTELYSEYGIAAVTLGEPSQMTFLSYYAAEEALKYQSPKVVIFDVASLFYSDKKTTERMYDEYANLHYTMDTMKNNLTKYRAFQQAKEINPDLDFWEYFSVFYYSHANWENLTEDNFTEYSHNMVTNGGTMVLDHYDGYAEGGPTPLSEQEYTDEIYTIPEFNMQYLEKMIDLCEEKGTQLVLIRSGASFPWTWKRYNAVSQVAQEHNIPFLDTCSYEEEMDFDWTKDLADERHFNVIGAKKWTDILGEYLKENFDLDDRRLDSSYDVYKEDEKKWTNGVEAMQLKLDFMDIMDFDDYLDALIAMDKEENVILMAVKYDMVENLSETSIEKMKQLGIDMSSVSDGQEYSFVCMIDDDGVSDNFTSGEAKLSGKFNGVTSYKIASGGGETQESLSIKIGGTEYSAGGNGINIVVYNKYAKKVLDSVSFDTNASASPSASR